MRRHRLSFSRILPCLYWARPDVEYREEPAGRPARVGTLVHRLAEAYVKGCTVEHKDVDLHELAEAQSIFSGPLKGWLDTWKASPGEHFVEERLRYDAERHAVFPAPRRDDAAYTPPGPMQLTGELDFVTVLDGCADVIDLKTGQKRYTNESQLSGYAVVAERRWGVKRVRTAFLYAKKTKIALDPSTELDADRLEAEAGVLRRTLRVLPTAEPVKGEHCYRCPMGKGRFGVCPAWPNNEYVAPEPPADTQDVWAF